MQTNPASDPGCSSQIPSHSEHPLALLLQRQLSCRKFPRSHRRIWIFSWLFLSALLAAPVGAAVKTDKEPTKSELEFFERKVRPILTEHCYSCHSRSAEKLKAGLLLDSREGLQKGGENGAVVIPGNPDSSRLIIAVRHSDTDLKMPPKLPLGTDQIADLEAWVRSGAAFPKSQGSVALAGPKTLDETRSQWPFTPLKAAAPPRVRQKDWPITGLDTILLARWESLGIMPAASRARTTDLIRRLSFDLTGLPPSIEAVARMGPNPGKGEIDRYIDELLESPRFGEKWGRHWLDIARYADSNGLEANQPYAQAWRYRDYVVKAFNADKPYDRFIREQIAGDLFQESDLEKQLDNLTATGFLVLGPKPLVEPNRDKLLMDVADEQIDVTMRGFQGITVSCARCHDHKFDPIPTRDYYSLAGIFRSTQTLRDVAGPGPGPNPVPWLERPLDSKEKMDQIEAYDRKLADLSGQIREIRRQRQMLPGGVASSNLTGIIIDNQKAVFSGSWKSSTYSTNRFLDRDYMQDGDREKGKKTAQFSPDLPKPGFYEIRLSYPAGGNRARNVPVTVFHARGSTRVIVDQQKNPDIENLWQSLGEFEFDAGTNARVLISTEATKGFVVADAVQFLPVESSKMMDPSKSVPPPPSTPAMTGQFLKADPDALQEELYTLQEKAPPRPATAMAVQDASIANQKVNLRGDVNRLGDEVPRGLPAILFPRGFSPPSIPPDQSGRLQLADWLSSTNNPLTARLAVNRVWMQLFGRPLAGTPDNFGALGERPNQPELLDHLALRFMQLGWSHKRLIREIVTSRTYQMSAESTASARDKDPDNQWYSRMPRRRLPAEAIRDAILQASGKLDLTMGGPPVQQDLGGTRAPLQIPTMEPPANSVRRSLYLPILRNNVPDILQAFDFADPHVLSARRNNTSAPTQSLYMLNSDFLHEQSLALAQELQSLASDSERLERLFLRTLSRPPTTEEKSRSLAFLEKFERMLSGSVSRETASSTRLESFRALAHSLFAGTEFRFLN